MTTDDDALLSELRSLRDESSAPAADQTAPTSELPEPVRQWAEPMLDRAVARKAFMDRDEIETAKNEAARSAPWSVVERSAPPPDQAVRAEDLDNDLVRDAALKRFSGDTVVGSILRGDFSGLSQIKKGFLKSAAGMASSGARGLQTWAETGADESTVGNVSRSVADVLEGASKRPDLQNKVSKLGDIRKEEWFNDTIDYLANATGEAAGSIVPLIAVSLAAPAVAGTVGGTAITGTVLGSLGTGAIREAFDEAKVDWRENKDVLYAAAAAHAALEYIPGVSTLRKLLTGQALVTFEKEVIKAAIKGAASGGVKEGITEGLQTSLEMATPIYAQSREVGDAVGALWTDVLKGMDSNILDATIKGTVGGGVFGGGAHGASAAAAKGKGAGEPGAQDVAPSPTPVKDTPTPATPARDISPSIDESTPAGRGPSVQTRAPDPELDAIRQRIAEASAVVPDENAPKPKLGKGLSEIASETKAPADAIARMAGQLAEGQIPTAREVMEAMPRDEAGDIDAMGFVQAVAQFGAKSYAALPDEQKVELYRKYAPLVEQAAPVVQQAVEAIGKAIAEPVSGQSQPTRPNLPPPTKPSPAPAQPRSEADLRQAFDRVLNSQPKIKRGEWANAIGADQTQLDTLVNEALADGRLKKTKAGGIVRTGKKVAPKPAGHAIATKPPKIPSPRAPTPEEIAANKAKNAAIDAQVAAARGTTEFAQQVETELAARKARAEGASTVIGAMMATRERVIDDLSRMMWRDIYEKQLETQASADQPSLKPVTMDRATERRLDAVKSPIARKYAQTLLEADDAGFATALAAIAKDRKATAAIVHEVATAIAGKKGASRPASLELIKAKGARKAAPAPAIVTEASGQTSLVPEVTDKDRLTVAANKPLRGGNAPTDFGLFGSGSQQLDLVEMTKATAQESARSVIAREPKPVSLIAFLRARGGINDDGGDLRAMEAHKRPGLVNYRSGLTLDHAREIAAEAGYLKESTEGIAQTSTADLLEAISEELAGRPTYSSADAGRVADLRDQTAFDIADDVRNTYVEQLQSWHEENDLAFRMSDREIDRAATLISEGTDIGSAVETAFIEAVEDEIQPGTAPESRRSVAEESLVGSFDDGAVAPGGAGATGGRVRPAGGQATEAEGVGASASDRNAGLERDWRDGPAQDGLGQADVPAAAGRDGEGIGAGGEGTVAQGPADGGLGVSDGNAAPLGAGSDLAVQGGAPGVDGRAAGRGERAGSGDAGELGVPAGRAPAEAVGQVAASASPIVQAIEAQRVADATVPFITNDPENIRASLPLLKPAQRDDVVKAEARFSKPNAFGFLFTNGTGSGKTFSGLGVVKRFVKQGKSNILILAPSQGILDGWVSVGRMIGLDVTRLPDTGTAGEGIVATTYANLRDNQALVTRQWDLLVADEAHNLSMNASGSPSDALNVFRALANKSPYTRASLLMKPEADALAALAEAVKTDKSRVAEYDQARGAHFQAVQDLAKTFEGQPRAKALFLSATPFAYRKNTDWAEGFLFDYPPQTSGYNNPGGQSQFLVSNFGYNMRYNRAEEPGPEVNVGVLEREFYERLKREGVLSGRRLEVEADYDRRFVLVDDAVGAKIDQALNWLSTEANGRYIPLAEKFREKFNYLAQRRLLEAIKAKHAIPRIKEDLALGRKVVVFHDYNEGGGLDAFAAPDNPNEEVRVPYGEKAPTIGELYYEFVRANPYVKKLNFAQFNSPIVTLTEAFPEAMVYNGRVPNKQRARARDEFNRDGSGRDIIIVQSAAGEAGISLHDTTGKHQRVLYNLGLPTRPTTAIQQEGRIYREGQVSDAILRYMSTGTGWERTAFAQTIAERASTAENLALGDEARALRDAFIDAFNEADEIKPSADEGKGGKRRDRTMGGSVTTWDRAKAFYFAEGKKRGRRDQREGKDYFATPEPIGLKMVEFADAQIGERILEPSAGHGAIARWFPEGANRFVIEPSSSLASRAGLASPGAKVIVGRFEDHYVGNKYDAIVMNPPFGSGGKDAFDHIQKAVSHLRDGGRVVAIVPRGGMADRRLEAFRDDEANKNIYTAIEIEFPTVMFERAGTKVASRLIVLEKHSTPDRAPNTLYRDLSDAETINELFDRIEGLSLRQRVRPGQSQQAAAVAVPAPSVSAAPVALTAPAPTAPASPAPTQPVTEKATADDGPSTAIPGVKFKLAEAVHGKTGADLFVASIAQFVPRPTYDALRDAAKKYGGYYSTFRGSGAIPGFQFPSEDKRTAFLKEVSPPPAPAPQTQATPSPEAEGRVTPALPDSEAQKAVDAFLARKNGDGPMFAIGGLIPSREERRLRNYRGPNTKTLADLPGRIASLWKSPPTSGTFQLFHATDRTFERFDAGKSQDFGVHFGTAEQAGQRLEDTKRVASGRTIPVEVQVKNAIAATDPGYWGPLQIQAMLESKGFAFTAEEARTFKNHAMAIDRAEELGPPAKKALQMAVVAANQSIRDKLNALGIDGIWYRNDVEGAGWSLLVWNEGQVVNTLTGDRMMALDGGVKESKTPLLTTEKMARRALMNAVVELGRSVALPKALQSELRSIMKTMPDILPSGTRSGFLVKVGPNREGAKDPIIGQFELDDGSIVSLEGSADTFFGNNALFVSRGGTRLVLHFRYTSPGENGVPALVAGRWHEAIHALYAAQMFDPATWRLLLDHANSIGVMDMSLRSYLTAIGTEPTGGSKTLRQAYTALYSATRSGAQLRRALDEEAVAIMTELLVMGVDLPLPDSIRQVYAMIETGEMARGAGVAGEPRMVSPDAVTKAPISGYPVLSSIAMTVSGGKNKSPMFAIRGFHGSPHDYAAERLVQWPDGRQEYIVGKPDALPDVPDGATLLKDFPLGRQRLDKIGTGEGMQAYSYGLYQAENEGVAIEYKEDLSRFTPFVNGTAIAPNSLVAKYLQRFNGDIAGGIKILERQIPEIEQEMRSANGLLNNMLGRNVVGDRPQFAGLREAKEALAAFRDMQAKGAVVTLGVGRVYEVEINAEPDQFLDWDKPLSEQPDAVLKLSKSAQMAEYMKARRDAAFPNRVDETGEMLVRALGAQMGEKAASRALLDAGIPGIKYLDLGSRASGEGTRNYVVVDDSLIEIVAKDGKRVSAAEKAGVIESLTPKPEDGPLFSIQSFERKTLARHFGATRIEDIGPTDPHPGRVLAFHGTAVDLEGDRFDVGKSRDFGVHFGTPQQTGYFAGTPDAAEGDAGAVPRFLAERGGGRVYPGILDLQNVLTMPDLHTWPAVETATAIERAAPETAGLVDRVSKMIDRAAVAWKSGPPPVQDAIRDALTSAGYDGIRYWNNEASEGPGWSYIVWEPGHVISATAGTPLFALGGGIGDTEASVDAQIGQSMRRDLDALGFYSKALEAARGLKQAKGTPEQMLAQLKSAGVKEAEIEATGLGEFLKGFGSTTALESNAITLPQSPVAKGGSYAVLSGDEVWSLYDKDPTVFDRIPYLDARQIKNEIHIVHERNGRVVGVAVLESNPNSKGELWVKGIGVDPEHRSGGIGRELADRVKQYGSQSGQALKLSEFTDDGQKHLSRYFNPQPHGDRTASPPRRASLKQVTKSAIVKFLEENRVQVKEVTYDRGQTGGDQISMDEFAVENGFSTVQEMADDYDMTVSQLQMDLEARNELAADKGRGNYDQTKWSAHSLDSSNPTYRETVLHLPAVLSDAEVVNGEPFWEPGANFRSGHFPEPNIVGHMMTSMTHLSAKDEGRLGVGYRPTPSALMQVGKANPNRPSVFTVDQVQGDWFDEYIARVRDAVAEELHGKTFDGLSEAEKAAVSADIGERRKRGEDLPGVKNEKKIAELKALLGKAQDELDAAMAVAPMGDPLEQVPFGYGRPVPRSARAMYDRVQLLGAEVATAEAAAPPPHPLASTLDNYLNLVLRRAIRQAAEAGADYIAIPTGATVESYNPQGDSEGNAVFYEKIVPKNLRNLLSKIDKASPAPIRIETLDSPSGKTGLGQGFALFPLTETVKDSVLEQGQPLFALGGGVPRDETPSFEEYVIQNTGKRAGSVDPSAVRVLRAAYGIEHKTDELGLPAAELDRLADEGFDTSEPMFRGAWGSISDKIAPGASHTEAAYWLTPQKDESRVYQDVGRLQDGSDVNGSPILHTAVVRPGRQLVVDSFSAPKKFLNKAGYVEFDQGYFNSVLDQAKAGGYNSVRFNDVVDVSPVPHDQVVVFNKDDIHVVRTVAENDEPDVRFALGGGIPPDAPGSRQPTPPGIANQPSPSTENDGAPSLNAVIQKLKDALGVVPTQTLMGVTIRAEDGSEVRLNPRANVRGQTQSSNAAVGVRRSRDIDTIAHEMAHVMEVTLGAQILDLQRDRADLLEAFAPGKTPSEQWAEWFSYYITNAPGARVLTKELATAFDDVIEASDPEMLVELHEAQDLYQQWLARATAEEKASDLVSIEADNSWKELRAESGFDNVPLSMASAYTKGIGRFNPIWHMGRKLLAVADRNGVRDPSDPSRPISLAFHEDPYKQARMFAGAYAAGYAMLTQGIANQGETTVSFRPLTDALEILFGSKDHKDWRQSSNIMSRGRPWAKRKDDLLNPIETMRRLAHGKANVMYHVGGQYLVSQAAIARYEQLEDKEARLAEIDKLMGEADGARSRMTAARARERDFLARREMALAHVETQLRERRRNLRQAENQVDRLQERIQDKNDVLKGLDIGRAGDTAAANKVRGQIDVLTIESGRANTVASRIRDEISRLEIDEAMLTSEAAQFGSSVEAYDDHLIGLGQSIDMLRAERKRTSDRGASRAPTRESKEWHQDFIDQVEADPKYARIKDFAAVVRQFQHGLLTRKYQAGFIGKEEYDRLSRQKDWYVPMMRDMSDAAAEDVFTGRMGKAWSPFKKFDGSDRAIVNPLEIMARDAYSTAQKIARNESGLALVNMAETAGPGAASIIQVLNREEILENEFDRIKDIAQSMGISEEDATLIVHQLEENYADAQLTAIWSPATKGPDARPTMPVYRNGERIMVRFVDREFGADAFQAFAGLGAEQRSWVGRMLAFPARLLTLGITSNPTFAIALNLVRDVPTAAILTESLPFVAQYRGAKAMRDPNWMRQYMEQGGIVGGRNVQMMTSQEQQMRVLDLAEGRPRALSVGVGAIYGGFAGLAAGGPAGALLGSMLGGLALRKVDIQKIADTMEMMTRVGVAVDAFERAKKHNPNLTDSEAMFEAAYAARSMFDWNDRGSRMLAWTQQTAFFNAQLRSLDAAVKAIGGETPRGSALVKHLKNVWDHQNAVPLSKDEERKLGQSYKVMTRWVLLSAFGLGMYILASSGDDDDKDRLKYEDIKDKTKGVRWWLPNFMGTGQDLKIAKPFEWALPGNYIEIIADGIRGRDPRVWSRMVDTTWDILAPPVIPDWMKLGAGLALNSKLDEMPVSASIRRMMGSDGDGDPQRKIIDDQLRSLDPQAQFDAYTSQLSIDIANGIGKTGMTPPSPKMIDFLLRSGGMWGNDAQKGYQALREAAGYRRREESRLSDYPVVGGFVGVAARQSKSREELHHLMARSGGVLVEAANGYANRLDKQNDPKSAVQHLMSLKPEERAYAMLKYYGAASEVKDHPLERLLNADAVASGVRRDIILDRVSRTHKENGKTRIDWAEKIELHPRKQKELHDILERLQQADAWNTMVLMKRPGWEGKREIKVEPILRELKSSHEGVFDLYESRLAERKVRDFSDVKETWPAMRDEILKGERWVMEPNPLQVTVRPSR